MDPPKHMPEDVLPNLLSRLPAKSILRFKSVCKSWLTLLTDADFIKLHAHRSTLKNPNLLIATSCPANFQTLDSDFLHLPNLMGDFDLPDDDIITVVGSCNGLICLSYLDNLIYLLNPSTRELVNIPLPPPCNDAQFVNAYEVTTTLGFGYDPVVKKYKVVRVIMFRERRHTDLYKQAMVYTLGTNSWKMLEDVPADRLWNTGTAHRTAQVNGILHWSGGPQGSRGNEFDSIISFNLTSKKFGKISWPNFKAKCGNTTLGVWQGHLVVSRDHSCGRLDIWMMEDYGLEESWTIVFSIEHPIDRRFEVSRLLVILKDSILLSRDFSNLVLYDPINKTARIPIYLDYPDDFFSAFPYVEDLTPIASLMDGTSMEVDSC